MKMLSIASRNIFRNWRRTLVTVTAMVFAGFIMILFASLIQGLMEAGERNAVAMDLGDIQIHVEGYREDPDLYKRIENADQIISDLQGLGYHATQRIYGFGLAAAKSSSAGVHLRGINISTESTVTNINSHIMQGAWLEESDPKGIVIGRKLAKTLGVHPGDEVVFIGQATDGSMANDLFIIRGILKAVNEDVDRTGFFMIESEFRSLMVLPHGAHEIAVMRADRHSDLKEATREVAEVGAGYETMNWRELKPVIARILDLADAQTIIMVLIMYTAVAMVVLNAMLMSVFERIRELGIMKAIGVRPWQIIRLVYTEAMVQVAIASIIAVILGWPISIYFQNNGIDLSSIAGGASFAGVAMDPIWKAYVTGKAILIPIVFLFLIALLAILYPALKAAMIQPVKAIHHR